MSREVMDAVVVGSGPSGLAAAVTLARAGLGVVVYEANATIGGGARTLDLGLDDSGVIHDLGSAVHPLALASPFFRAFDLPACGVELVVPEASYAHPLDGGRAAIAWRDLDRTVADLPSGQGRRWRGVFGPLVERGDEVIGLALSDKRSLPEQLRSPAGLGAGARFAAGMLAHGTRLSHALVPGEESGALLGGVAAHAASPLPSFGAAGAALFLGTLGHTTGWGLAPGGAQAMTDALAADLLAHGGRIVPGAPITTWRELPRARAYLFDTSPRAVARIWGERMPPRAARALRRFPYGAASAKVDFVLSEPVPWEDPRVGRTATVHVGGSRLEMARAEAEVAAGRHASAPMVIASDPAQTVPAREVAGLRPLWAYAHVPAGSPRDVTEEVTRQIERFAPGFRDVVVASHPTPAREVERLNANYIGGDVASGAVNLYRYLARPTPWPNPYSGGIPGVYLCSASTPPGPGVHGMNGWHAATRALRQRFGITTPPSLSPEPRQS